MEHLPNGKTTENRSVRWKDQDDVTQTTVLAKVTMGSRDQARGL